MRRALGRLETWPLPVLWAFIWLWLVTAIFVVMLVTPPWWVVIAWAVIFSPAAGVTSLELLLRTRDELSRIIFDDDRTETVAGEQTFRIAPGQGRHDELSYDPDPAGVLDDLELDDGDR